MTSPPIAARRPSSCSASAAQRRRAGRTSTWSARPRPSRVEVRVAGNGAGQSGTLRVTWVRSTIGHKAGAGHDPGLGPASAQPDHRDRRHAREPRHDPPRRIPAQGAGAGGGEGRRGRVKLHDLQPPSGAHKPARRVGRGHGSGRGKTAGRGTKGQKSRAGSSIPAWFEGGQTPLHVRTPKLHGFKNRFRVEYAGLNLGRLSDVAAGTLVTPDVLRHDGLLRRSKTRVLPVKILGGGDAPKGVTIHAHAFTRSALEKLQAAGSTAQRISWPDGAPIDEAAEAKETAAAEAEAEAKAEQRVAKAEAKAEAKSQAGGGHCRRGRRRGARCRRSRLRDHGRGIGSEAGRSRARDRRKRGRVLGDRLPGHRLPRAGHPAQDPLHARDPVHLQGPDQRASGRRRPGTPVAALRVESAARPARPLLRWRTGDGLDHRHGREPLHQRQHHHAADG